MSVVSVKTFNICFKKVGRAEYHKEEKEEELYPSTSEISLE